MVHNCSPSQFYTLKFEVFLDTLIDGKEHVYAETLYLKALVGHLSAGYGGEPL